MRKLTLICAVVGLLFPLSTTQAATVITTPQQLQDIVNDLAGDYVLGADIDLTGFAWAGIGHTMQAPFTGTFDGDFHIINGLTATDDLSYAPYKHTSLFGIVGVGGVVKNVGMTNVDISAGWYGGALVGDLKGEVSKCFVDGGTVSTMVEGGNDGTLIGLIRETGVVTDCYSTAEFEIVTTSQPEFAQYKGGFTGGIAGQIDTGLYSTVTNAYFAGTITGDGIMDGLGRPFAGYISEEQDNRPLQDRTVSGLYYDKDLLGDLADDDPTGTRGRTTAEMMTQATFEGYDFENTWSIVEGQSYPTLTEFVSFNRHPGDANLDGDVDVWDFDGTGDAQILSENLGTMIGATWGMGDFNGDGDVDVWDLDGSGDAQILSENLGWGTDVGQDAAAGTAEALYDPATGELSFDVGSGVAVVGIGSAVMYPGAVDATSIFGAPIQSTNTTLAYFDTGGLPVGEDSVGLVLPPGLTQEQLTFSYTPTSGPTQKVDVTIVPEPSTFAMLGVLLAIALCWRRRRA